MEHDVLEGDVFLFVSRDRKRAKSLYIDGTGMCLFANQAKKYRCACGGCIETAMGSDTIVAGGRYSIDLAVSVARRPRSNLPRKQARRLPQPMNVRQRVGRDTRPTGSPSRRSRSTQSRLKSGPPADATHQATAFLKQPASLGRKACAAFSGRVRVPSCRRMRYPARRPRRGFASFESRTPSRLGRTGLAR